MQITMPVEWYTREEAARRLSLAPATLKRLAAEGKGPAYSRSGERKGKCLYAAADLAAWAESRKTTPRVCRGATSKASGG